MKVVLQNAITANGFVSGPNHNTDWVSEEDWKDFISLSKSIGVVIIGRVTYELMKSAGELANFSGVKVVVLTKNSKQVKKEKNILISDKSPKEILTELKKLGFKKTLVAGGGRLNGSFLKEKLIDEMYLDIHPFITTSGTHLFEMNDQELNLELFETKKLSKNVLQLHYKAKK